MKSGIAKMARWRGRSHSEHAAGYAIAVVVALLLPACLFAQEEERRINDFPTYARAEYVYVCMSTNGESEYVLRQCSCAIDEIAKRMPYDDYVSAETAVRLQRMQGEKAAQFREVEVVRKLVSSLQAAQAEAEIACF